MLFTFYLVITLMTYLFTLNFIVVQELPSIFFIITMIICSSLVEDPVWVTPTLFKSWSSHRNITLFHDEFHTLKKVSFYFICFHFSIFSFVCSDFSSLLTQHCLFAYVYSSMLWFFPNLSRLFPKCKCLNLFNILIFKNQL